MLFVDDSTRAREPNAPGLRERQPAVYATRLVREPSIVSARTFEHFRAAHVHSKVPACIELKCERCADIDAIERLAMRGEVALHPVVPPFPVAVPGKERK